LQRSLTTLLQQPENVERIVQAVANEKKNIGQTIAELPSCDFTVEAAASTESLKDAFDRRIELPGAIVVDGDRVLEAISRDSLFRHLSRAFFREIFLKRPIGEFVEMWCGEMLRLEAVCTINRAAELALARPHEQAFEPILVDYGGRVGLLDVQVLLVAQAQLLSLSRLVEEQRDAAEAANRSKSEFLANISHELRTPLHGILSYSKFGLNEAATAEREELREFFHNVNHCADNLLHLVNDLLDLSKLEAGRMSLDLRLADLGPLVEIVIDEFRSLCAEQKLTIRYARPEQPIAATIDPDRMQQVIRNLLSNAVKFSPASGTIYVRLRQVGKAVLLSVRDQGPGIPPAELEAVFDKFVQSSKTKSNQGGTGLGLAICREIVGEHKGRIWAENNQGAGCIFYVELLAAHPDASSGPSAAAAISAAQDSPRRHGEDGGESP
jgi:signal transduction histidine kinase